MVFFVATPIGNLSDISQRALETLQKAHCIFCEDTRHSSILLKHYGIEKPLYSYHKFNEKASIDFVIKKAMEGDVAVISDAGTPCVSDPGRILVEALKQKAIPYTVIPGACALISAFVLSGYQAPFSFCGFLPEKNVDKTHLLNSVNKNGCLIFYVAVHNIKKDFAFLLEQLGDRDCCLVKELSKIHEKAIFTTLSNAPNETKGEFVLIVDKNSQKNPLCELSVKEHVNHYIEMGLTKNESIKQTAKDRGVQKNEIYSLMID